MAIGPEAVHHPAPISRLSHAWVVMAGDSTPDPLYYLFILFDRAIVYLTFFGYHPGKEVPELI
ncbi:MAG TPA: hypothetical protein PKX44_08730, partial [Methanomassiliicoccaceae archaeon]|nr:hypothetical protein [Methanomassiliicoccaceae archaeon]